MHPSRTNSCHLIPILSLSFQAPGADVERTFAAGTAALIGALDAPFAPIWVWIGFGGTPGSATLIGSGIILVAVKANVFSSARKAPAPA